MKVKKFVKEYDQAPYELHEFAEAAQDVSDDIELAQKAAEFLQAKEEFEKALERVGCSVG